MNSGKDRARSKQNDQNIHLRKTQRNTHQPSNRQEPAFHRRAPESPERLQNHGNHDWLYAIQHRRNLRQMSETHVRPGNDSHQNRRRKNKTHAANDQPCPSGRANSRCESPIRWSSGPGIRLLAPSRSRNFSRESHFRRRTSSSSMMAICAAGPPNAVTPSRRKKSASSLRDPRFASSPGVPVCMGSL